MDSSQAPLISGGRHEDELEHDDHDHHVAIDATKLSENSPGAFVLLLTFAAGISGLLFGCMA